MPCSSFTRLTGTALALLLALGFSIPAVNGLDNGLGKTPPMGWNSWNLYDCNINENVIRATAEAMVNTGLMSLGYTYVNIDDCWQLSRSANGTIEADPDKFPSGIKALADYVHSLGLQFGIYSDAGTLTCGGRPGSLGYEEQDAATYAEWGVDFLKYDNCFNEAQNLWERYGAMRDALLKQDRRIFYSMCEWGVANPWEWGAEYGNSWRTTDDIKDDWLHVMYNADNSINIAKYGGPGGWNDLDMLEIGNGGMSYDEYKVHFAVWAAVKSPLLIGCNVSAMTDETLEILSNAELIAVNQDALGVPADIVYHVGNEAIYAGPLSDGARVVIMVNRHSRDNSQDIYFWENGTDMTVKWEQIGLHPSTEAVVRDLYKHADIGVFTRSFTSPVTVHGVLALRITPKYYKPSYRTWRPWIVQPRAYNVESNDEAHQILPDLTILILGSVLLLSGLVYLFLANMKYISRRSTPLISRSTRSSYEIVPLTADDG